LGRKWHLSRKGFPPGKRIMWETETLEELFELLTSAAPECQFLWNNQQLVHAMLPGQREPWATVNTKKVAAIELALTGPKGRFALGRIAELGAEREIDSTARKCDVIKLKICSTEHVHHTEFAALVAEHAAACAGLVGAGV
jgi:excinuclease ABC subunit A